jgi:hypothetical protein
MDVITRNIPEVWSIVNYWNKFLHMVAVMSDMSVEDLTDVMRRDRPSELLANDSTRLQYLAILSDTLYEIANVGNYVTTRITSQSVRSGAMIAMYVLFILAVVGTAAFVLYM